MQPQISLYIPTRGRPRLVQRAVQSSLAQTHSLLEVLVVIDGPDPETLAVLAPFRADPRVRIIERDAPGGACVARNQAIFEARGELITGLDDDDELLPDHVETLHKAFDATKSSFAATTSLILRREDSLVRHAFTGAVGLDALLAENIVGNQVLTQTHHLRQLGGFDPAMPAWQDYDLWVRLVERFGPGHKVDARTYIQHQEHDEVRISSRDRILDAHQRFIAKHASLLTPTHLASLELLRFATTHEAFELRRLLAYSRIGLGKRALFAYVSNRFPRARRAALILGSRTRAHFIRSLGRPGPQTLR